MLARGCRVRALARDTARAARVLGGQVELVAGDLADTAALEQLVSDSTAVIHAAGAVRGASAADFDRVNVDGTAAILDAMTNISATPTLVLVSSLAAREPQLSWYAHSKRAAEELVQARAGADWLIVRPPAVYGPGDREMLPLFRAMQRGWVPVPGDPKSRFSLVHVSDLVRAIADCLEAPSARRATFTPCDGRPRGYDWAEVAGIAGEVCGRRVRVTRVPAPLLDAVAASNLALSRALGRQPMLTPPKLRELRHPDWVVDNSEITRACGWQPAIGLREGLADLLGVPLG